MRFAILADIHGNADALAAVLRDMDLMGVQDAVNLGDHFSGPLDAEGTARLLMDRDFASIRGNHDRWLLEMAPDDMSASDRAAFDQLNPDQLDWLRDLPASRLVFGDVFLCHGTPASDVTYWLEKVEADGTIRSARLEEVETHAVGLKASLILCGHTHLPRIVRLRDGRVTVNPGSVGCPAYDDDVPVFHVMQTGTPNASYAIAERTGDDWTVTFRSVPYDAGRMVDLARSRGKRDWAQAVATGWIDQA